MNIPIFPLPIFLLPQGVTRLRIFEQRYLNMVKNAQNTNGFVISFYRNTMSDNIADKIAPWRSLVEIVNFTQGADGILIIDVKCKSLVTIESTSVDDNNLLHGNVSVKPHWGDLLPIDALQTLDFDVINVDELSQQLNSVFTNNENLNSLYQQQYYENPRWVCARWLEILPLEFLDKSLFSEPDSFLQAADFLNSIIVQKKTENIYFNM